MLYGFGFILGYYLALTEIILEFIWGVYYIKEEIISYKVVGTEISF